MVVHNASTDRAPEPTARCLRAKAWTSAVDNRLSGTCVLDPQDSILDRRPPMMVGLGSTNHTPEVFAMLSQAAP